MQMSDVPQLILTIKDPQVIQSVNFERQNLGEISLSIISGKIISIQVISGLILVIKFETGEIRLDIANDDLLKLEYME